MAAELAGLYDDDRRFRSTINMGQHRFGAGEYRYFARPLPAIVDELKHALYPRLLPIARDWWARLGRPAPWPDTLDEWLAQCHDAGQNKPTAILLKYGAGDWNAVFAREPAGRCEAPPSLVAPSLVPRSSLLSPGGAAPLQLAREPRWRAAADGPTGPPPC